MEILGMISSDLVLNYREAKERPSENSEGALNLDSVKNGSKKQEMQCQRNTNETFSSG